MIRRNIPYREKDPRAVRWSLVAAALALSLGSYAEMVVSAEQSEPQPAAAVAGESVESEPSARIAS